MNVHSKDVKSWLTKLRSIGKISSLDKDVVFNNLGHIINIEMMEEQYAKLSGDKAVGIDGLTKEEYGKMLGKNLASLMIRLRRGKYKPQPAKVVEIPKEDGSKRPLAISCIEDKLVQTCVNKVLLSIYEPIFLPCSYGARPKRNCHDALRTLLQEAFKNQDGAIIEIDIRKYFNSIPHEELMKCLCKKISDRRFLGLIRRLLKAPEMETDGTITPNVSGCPQGSIISPILANIYLHYVIDSWFSEISKTHIRGRAGLVRYIDDMVFTFQNKKEAYKIFEVLPKRLKKYGLELHLGKSKVLEAGNIAAIKARMDGRKLETFNFLGFTCYWGKSRDGRFWRLKYKTRKERFTSKLKGLRQYLRKNLNTKSSAILPMVKMVVRGWVNYYGISDNHRSVNTFILRCKIAIFNWLNRKGGKKKMNWVNFTKLLKQIEFPERWRTVSMFTKPNK